ncbi:major facilitator superfamily MFS_1 [mine drainage metagenome]|uniref:Major facilitator superfamily MFS_1 n=1 Tax=mine drainage metagenome TaxID=410659 RepID=T0ZJT0_9ZZZZ
MHAPVYVYGIVMGVSYGGGSLLGYVGGRLSDRYGRKRIAILGNALIPILSLSGIATSFYESAVLFSGGWLSRNFRSPARRALISDEAKDSNRGKIFGFLNALDVGGGVASIIVLLTLLYLKVPLPVIILATAIPIIFATILLVFVKEKKMGAHKKDVVLKSRQARIDRKAYLGVIIATGMFGFSYYSLGFPILTIAQSQSSDALGFASYMVFLLASALFGYFIGSRKLKLIPSLGGLGYVLSATGTLLLGFSYVYALGVIPMYFAVVIIGMAIGTIDTLEPSLIAQVKPRRERGSGMGALTASRSMGLFFGNIVMGVLYYFGPFYSYVYAAIAAAAAGIILLKLGRGSMRFI